MKITCDLQTETWRIDSAPALGPIHVFWMDVSPNQGYVTIICYGRAWTAYFGGMPVLTIREFFAMADEDYLVNKLTDGNSPKKDKVYLRKIILAIKDALAEILP